MDLQNRQFIEALSWHVAAEMLRSYPARLRLIQTHPGGDQYDCLTLLDRAALDGDRGAIQLNRLGTMQVHRRFDGGPLSEPAVHHWSETLEPADPRDFIRLLSADAGLPPIDVLPSSTPEVLVYRVIAALLSTTAFGREEWHVVNGYRDSSGYGSGAWEQGFELFPAAAERRRVREAEDFLAVPEYRFWFITRAGEPLVALETTGMAWRLDRQEFPLPRLYQANGRRIWPLVCAVGAQLLP